MIVKLEEKMENRLIDAKSPGRKEKEQSDKLGNAEEIQKDL